MLPDALPLDYRRWSPSLLPDLDETYSLVDAESSLAAALFGVDGYSWVAISWVYAIYTSGSWREGHDDDGVPYTNFEDYIRGLRGRIPRMSVRWAQQNIAAIAALSCVGVPLSALYASSPAKVLEVARAIDYDKKSDTIRGYRVVGGKETVLRLVDEAAHPDVRYTDLRARVRAEMRTPETSWQLITVSERLYELVCWHDDLRYSARLHLEKGFPLEALAALRRRLGVE